MPSSVALLTDRYELTMIQASLASGAAHRRSVFEVFSRRLGAATVCSPEPVESWNG
jgi:nicotinic acid phosphoribosyltransferase